LQAGEVDRVCSPALNCDNVNCNSKIHSTLTAITKKEDLVPNHMYAEITDSIKLCPMEAQTSALPLLRDHDLGINTMTLGLTP